MAIRGIGWALLGVLVLAAVPVSAQQPPARIANTYGGTHHEPAPSAGEQGLTPQQQQQQTATVEQLDRQVQRDAAMPAGTAAGCTPTGTACPP